jgi:hypothetical protein
LSSGLMMGSLNGECCGAMAWAVEIGTLLVRTVGCS